MAPHPFPAQPLCQRLREAGDAGGDTRLTDEVRPGRPAPGPACRTLQFAPGQGAPVDWGSAGWRRVGAPRRRLACLVRGLGYRRRMLVEFTLAPTQEHCLAGHQHAFESFGGVSAEVLGDHGKPAVRSHPLGPPAVFPPRYRDFAQHYGCTSKACGARKPHEQGRVEQAVPSVKQNFLAGLDRASLDALNAAARPWLDPVANVRVHGATHPVGMSRFAGQRWVAWHGRFS